MYLVDTNIWPELPPILQNGNATDAFRKFTPGGWLGKVGLAFSLGVAPHPE